MARSYDILAHHPVNEKRRQKGLKPANSAWLWSPGKNPSLPSFKEKWGLDATVISAVDLIKGIGICAGAKVPNIEGATGNVHTNYEGKAKAAIDAFSNGDDFVFVHVEAPDECGHQGNYEEKVLSLELIDSKIAAPVLEYLKGQGDFRVLVMPDHPTPLATMTHSAEAVPYLIYDSRKEEKGADSFTEEKVKDGKYIEHGPSVMDMLLEK
jgi:2,3-bisphosphoglycerate-independent phosphoglycerate mutase